MVDDDDVPLLRQVPNVHAAEDLEIDEVAENQLCIDVVEPIYIIFMALSFTLLNIQLLLLQ